MSKFTIFRTYSRRGFALNEPVLIVPCIPEARRVYCTVSHLQSEVPGDYNLVLMGTPALLPRCRTLYVSKKYCVRFSKGELSFCNRLSFLCITPSLKRSLVDKLMPSKKLMDLDYITLKYPRVQNGGPVQMRQHVIRHVTIVRPTATRPCLSRPLRCPPTSALPSAHRHTECESMVENPPGCRYAHPRSPVGGFLLPW